MPFIIQCPHAECRKFMLLEDSTRGSTAECLLCKKPIKVDASAAGSSAGSMTPPPAAPQPAPAGAPRTVAPPPPPRTAHPASTAATKVLQCPHCNTSLRLPPGNVSAIKCPKCGQVFKV